MGPKILIVDDEEAILKALGGPLEREGYEVISCATAEAARENNSREVDLALVDVWLPDGDGVNLLEQFIMTGFKPCIENTHLELL